MSRNAQIGNLATTLTCETFENERENLEQKWIGLCNQCKDEDTGCSFPPEPCENMFDCESCKTDETCCEPKLNCKFDGTCSLRSCDSWYHKKGGGHICQSIQDNCKPNYKKELSSKMKFEDYLVACGGVVYIGVYSHNKPGDTLYLKIKKKDFGFSAENITNNSKYYGLRCINIRGSAPAPDRELHPRVLVMMSENGMRDYYDIEGNKICISEEI